MTSSGERLIELKYRIAETEKRIGRQRKAIERMTSEGRDARTAAFVLDYFVSSLEKMVHEQASIRRQAPVQREPKYADAAREDSPRASLALAARPLEAVAHEGRGRGDRPAGGWFARLRQSLAQNA